jgi:hypothetical protein
MKQRCRRATHRIPPHHHVHSELSLIREGTVELAVRAKTYRLGPGSVGHSNDEKGIKNIGATPATYLFRRVAIGPGADS